MNDGSNGLLPGGGSKAGGTMTSSPAIDRSRRRFVKGGAVGAPVILTLTSRPVFGFENACVAPSRMISGNFSGFDGPTTCGGDARSVWESRANATSMPAWAKRKFTDVFGTAKPYGTTATGKKPEKLGHVLSDSIKGNDQYAVPGFASFMIAAYLNAYYGKGSVQTVLKTSAVVDMWNAIVGKGEYCPQLNMCWNADGTIGYLKSSGIVPS